MRKRVFLGKIILAAILMIYLFGWEDEGHIKMVIKKVIRAIIK
jgi:hypothetical protein